MIFLRSVNLIFLTVFWSTCSFEMKSGFLSFIGKPQSISSVAMMVQNFTCAQHRILITVNIFYAFTRSHLKSINVSRSVIEGLPRALLNLPFLQICASHRSKCLSNVLILDCGFYFSSNVKVLHKQSKRRHIWCHAAP